MGRENMCGKNGEILVINKEKCIEDVTGYKIYLDINKIEKHCLCLLQTLLFCCKAQRTLNRQTEGMIKRNLFVCKDRKHNIA